MGRRTWRRRPCLERQKEEQALPAKMLGSRPLGRVAVPSLGVIGVAAVLGVVAGCGGGGQAGARAADTADSAPFGQHYQGLVQRREAAAVPTMMQTMDSRVHFHPILKVFVDGKPVPVPANIGIDPRVDGMQMAGLHTHDASGTIHVEGLTGATLGQFFAVWGVPLSAGQLGPYRAGGGNSVRMWVDGRPSNAFGSLALADGQRIVISFGPPNAPAPSE